MKTIKELLMRVRWRSFLKKKKFNFYLHQDSPGKSRLALQEALHRNGVITERAKRRNESLSKIERNIISATRDVARKNNIGMDSINAFEMEGERCWDLVLKPLSVVAVFSYYEAPFEDIPAGANYLVRESNHPALGVGSHVCAEQLLGSGLKIPKTPTYEQWVKAGQPVVRV